MWCRALSTDELDVSQPREFRIAIGRLVIPQLSAERVKFKSFEIEELKVTRIWAREIIVERSLKLPEPETE